ncbi:MAG: hypothetical protein AB8I08_10760 [Sandaracinaceae bacterium]
MSPSLRTAAVIAVIAGPALVGCALDPAATPPNPVRSSFETSVYPVLLRDCGFPACHGNEDRFFRVYGPGRTRLDPTAPGDMPLDAEIDASYERARSMLSGVDQASDSLLLRKPLEVDRGGAPHLGIDDSGRDVYGSPDDPGYAAILTWSETGF